METINDGEEPYVDQNGIGHHEISKNAMQAIIDALRNSEQVIAPLHEGFWYFLRISGYTIIETKHDRCNSKTGYHSSPHKDCMLR